MPAPLTRFELGDEAGFRAFLAKEPRTVVLLRGHGCPYSATFEPVFTQATVPPGWAKCLRIVEEGGRGPVGDALGVQVTPTVIAFVEEKEAARLDGKLFLGITRTNYARWLKALASGQ
jgi:hypothetical protein